MANQTARDYKFAIGRQIKRIFVESELFLDGRYNEYNPLHIPSVRRIDKPLFLLLDNGALARLHSTSLSVADDYSKEYVFSKDFLSNEETQKEFDLLCGLTIMDIKEFHENKYDLADEKGHIPSCADAFNDEDGPTHLVIVFDSGLRLVCNAFLDYFDINIVESSS